ncbi:hypothetical protein ACUNV4_17090 [Granulosicoccus sp. 3-233]|uniref:hypothetical protein n=1 Tax=Granulosicoccus sp. 3-233 TaxID=3417969 RepID=UPI003D35817E
MRSGHFIGVLIAASLPLGCASWQEPGSPDISSTVTAEQRQASAMQLIAQDFVIALRQIPALPPVSTTVSLLQSERDDPFTRHMREALQAAGYGTRWVQNAAPGLLFQYRHENGVDRASRQDLYEVAIGHVELRRRFATDGSGLITPATPLYVRGADASDVVMDDSRFSPSSQLAGRSAPNGSESVDTTMSRPVSSTGTRGLAVPQEANPLNPLIAGTDRRRELGMPLLALPRVENVFDIGGSNFTDILADSLLVREQILTFANDSLRLGAVNKTLVEQMVESFQPETDVFSVLGCSLGPTQLKSGNAALALGRASRVREALLFAGVPQERILDEGCWASDGSGKALPRRGVVVTLNRKT